MEGLFNISEDFVAMASYLKKQTKKQTKTEQSNLNTHSREKLDFSGILESSPGEMGLGVRERREGGEDGFKTPSSLPPYNDLL